MIVFQLADIITLLLHGCEPVQLVTLHYCCLQK